MVFRLPKSVDGKLQIAVFWCCPSSIPSTDFKVVDMRNLDTLRKMHKSEKMYPIKYTHSFSIFVLMCLVSVTLAQEVGQFPTDCDCRCDNNMISNFISLLSGAASAATCFPAGPFLYATCIGGSLTEIVPALIGLGQCNAVNPPECGAVCACKDKCTKRVLTNPHSVEFPNVDPIYKDVLDQGCLRECHTRVIQPNCEDIPCEGGSCIFAGEKRAVELRSNFFACGWCDFDPNQVQPCRGGEDSPGLASLCEEMLRKTNGKCGFNMVRDVKPKCQAGCEAHKVLGRQKCVNCTASGAPCSTCGSAKTFRACQVLLTSTGTCDSCRQCRAA